MIDRHWHWKFAAHDGECHAREITWAVTVEVVGYLCEADARIAAADIVTRAQYELTGVWECSSCGFKQNVADSLRTMTEQA